MVNYAIRETRMKRLPLALALTLPAIGVQAQAPDIAQVRSWAGACANCHGTNGNAEAGTAVLAGMNRDEMTRKMMAFKNGRQLATVMHQLSKGYTDEQIAAIAAYFAAQKR
jgi:cytochrome subunit of sulfide dehydrogenase